MTSLNVNDIDKPIETIRRDSLPKATRDDVAIGLQSIVAKTAEDPDLTHAIDAPFHTLTKLRWVQKLIPGIERLAVEYHCGNYVAVRGSDEQFFESMPLFARHVFIRLRR
jgi:phosphatidylserine decarboxylase